MKRDMDLIRNILLEIEEKESATSWVTLSLEGFSEEQVNYHLNLLDQVGFLEVKKLIQAPYLVRNLTMRGHDFLGSIRNDELYANLKSRLGETIKSLPLSVVSSVAIEVAKEWTLKKLGFK
ncbi:DUF2513 domain-containing protein [Fictibacillus sp. JL2B1089]|uniref:DUF2513 domain-containing protein n=1 Tax=Fictibacillus sp. JL2B1089 TaxID=3399565 RepID=UPI003A884DBA